MLLGLVEGMALIDTTRADPFGAQAREQIMGLIEDLRQVADPADFDFERFGRFRYDGRLAEEILAAGVREDGTSYVQLCGEIAGSLRLLAPFDGGIVVSARIANDLRLAAPIGSLDIDRTGVIGGDLIVTSKGTVGADVELAGVVEGWVRFRGRVDGSLVLRHTAKVGGNLDVSRDAVVGRHLTVGDNATVRGSVRVLHADVGSVFLTDNASIGADLRVSGIVEHVLLDRRSSVARRVEVEDVHVGGRVFVGRDAEVGTLRVGGEVGAAVVVEGRVKDDAALTMTAPEVGLVGRFEGGVSVVPSGGTSSLASVAGAQFERPVHLGDGVSIVGCDFRRCGDLEKLELVGADLFATAGGGTAKALVKPEGATDGEMASIYRQLRVNLEGKGNRPASAFFYRGEMDSRRRAAGQQRRWAEWAWLGLYRIVAGYGLRVAPPLLWFLAVWAAATAVFLLRGLVVLHGDIYVSASWWQAASFSLQSMLSVFRPPDALLGLGTTVVQVGLRLVGPVLLGLAAFAVRDKVAR